MSDGFYYLATVFSKHPDGLAIAMADSAIAAAELIRAGVTVFSPITHTYPIALWGNIDPLDLDIWLALDEPLMRAARGLIVVTAPGWDESIGIRHEIGVFTALKRPIFYWQPGEPVPPELLS